jgi:hypothetical protein
MTNESDLLIKTFQESLTAMGSGNPEKAIDALFGVLDHKDGIEIVERLLLGRLAITISGKNPATLKHLMTAAEIIALVKGTKTS